jgi:hypothetical protein
MQMAEQEDPGKALRAKSLEEFARRTKGKPTPTQAENDRAAMGEHVLEHEADGSDPDENAAPVDMHHQRKQSEAKPGSSAPYQTRQATPAKPTT